jgi:hypothetical protein
VAGDRESTFTRNLLSLHGKRMRNSPYGWLAIMYKSMYVTLLNPLTGATLEIPPADDLVGGQVIQGNQWIFLPPGGS